jgi:cytochrome P450
MIAFIKESMQMIAHVPDVSRVLTPPMRFGDVIVPSGTDVDLAIYSLYHHPDFWPEHEEQCL